MEVAVGVLPGRLWRVIAPWIGAALVLLGPALWGFATAPTSPSLTVLAEVTAYGDRWDDPTGPGHHEAVLCEVAEASEAEAEGGERLRTSADGSPCVDRRPRFSVAGAQTGGAWWWIDPAPHWPCADERPVGWEDERPPAVRGRVVAPEGPRGPPAA